LKCAAVFIPAGTKGTKRASNIQKEAKGRDSVKKFIPREKMSKKARRELDRAQRGMWEFSPVSRKVESRKVYNRKRSRVRDMDGTGSFCFG